MPALRKGAAYATRAELDDALAKGTVTPDNVSVIQTHTSHVHYQVGQAGEWQWFATVGSDLKHNLSREQLARIFTRDVVRSAVPFQNIHAATRTPLVPDDIYCAAIATIDVDETLRTAETVAPTRVALEDIAGHRAPFTSAQAAPATKKEEKEEKVASDDEDQLDYDGEDSDATQPPEEIEDPDSEMEEGEVDDVASSDEDDDEDYIRAGSVERDVIDSKRIGSSILQPATITMAPYVPRKRPRVECIDDWFALPKPDMGRHWVQLDDIFRRAATYL